MPRKSPDDKLIEELRRMQSQIASDLSRTAEAYPLAFFKPNPFQYRALSNLVHGCKQSSPGIYDPVENIAAEIPGNGTGKTWGVIALAGAICTHGGLNLWYSNYSLIKHWPFPKDIRFIADKKLFEDSGEVRKAIKALWPSHLYTEAKGDYSYYSSYTFPATGFVINCMTFDQGMRAHEGGEHGLVVFLEPPEDQAIWNCYDRSFRHGGIKLLSATLAYGSEWIDAKVLQREGTIITYGTPMDNCEQTTLQTPFGLCRGALSKKSVDSMFANYDEQEREMRFSGIPLFRRGMVLKELWVPHLDDNSEYGLVVDEAVVNKIKFPIAKINIDPHPGKPWCFVVAGIDVHNECWIIDEWPRFDTFGRLYHDIDYDKPEHGEAFYFGLIKELREQFKAGWLVLDFKMANSPSRTIGGTSTLRQRMEYGAGAWFDAQDVDVVGHGGGLQALKSALRRDRGRKVDFTNHSKLHVSSRCRNTIYQLGQLRWKKSGSLTEYGSEILDPRFLDYPRGVMSLLTHNASYKSESPEQAAVDKANKIRGKAIEEAAQYHPNWEGGALTHA